MTRRAFPTALLLIALAVPQAAADPLSAVAPAGDEYDPLQRIIDATLAYYEDFDPNDSPQEIANKTIAFAQEVVGEVLDPLCRTSFDPDFTDIADEPVGISKIDQGEFSIKLPGHDTSTGLFGIWTHEFRVDNGWLQCGQSLAPVTDHVVEQVADSTGIEGGDAPSVPPKLLPPPCWCLLH